MKQKTITIICLLVLISCNLTYGNVTVKNSRTSGSVDFYVGLYFEEDTGDYSKTSLDPGEDHGYNLTKEKGYPVYVEFTTTEGTYKNTFLLHHTGRLEVTDKFIIIHNASSEYYVTIDFKSQDKTFTELDPMCLGFHEDSASGIV